MPATVVCISAMDGADGEAVGVAVASELGYRYVDQEIVVRAAEKTSVDPAMIADAERRKSFVRRLLDGLTGPPAYVDPVAVPSLDVARGAVDLRDVIRSVIDDLADEGRVVIVSHAASMALGGTSDVLRILVIASPDVRAERVSRSQGLDGAAAARAIRDADRNRQDYIRRFYGIDREEVTHYDVVVSTDQLTPAQAAAIVCTAARSAG